MTNLEFWQTFVGEETPESFMRTYGSMDVDLCLARFLEDRNHLYGVVNQGQWTDTFQATDQYQRLTVEVYLRSYLEETREEWWPALEAKPPSIPRRYREKFDQDKYPPVEDAENSSNDAEPEASGEMDSEAGAEPVEQHSGVENNDTAEESAEQASDQENAENADANGNADLEAQDADEATEVAEDSPETSS